MFKLAGYEKNYKLLILKCKQIGASPFRLLQYSLSVATCDNCYGSTQKIYGGCLEGDFLPL